MEETTATIETRPFLVRIGSTRWRRRFAVAFEASSRRCSRVSWMRPCKRGRYDRHGTRAVTAMAIARVS